MVAVYSGSLELDKVTGIRHDLGQKMTKVKVKKPYKCPTPPKSVKLRPGKTRNGEQY